MEYNDSNIQTRCENCLEWIEVCKCKQYGLEENSSQIVKTNMEKQIIWNSEHLGKAILYGTIFFSLWFIDVDMGEDISGALIMLMFYFLFGGMFLDAMKKLWKYEKFS